MISRTEMVWRHLLVSALDEQKRRTSLTELAQGLSLPVSTVHRALERPRSIGVIRGSAAGLRVLDPRRLQLLWAGTRDLSRDCVYATRIPGSVGEIESRLPSTSIPTAFTAFVRHEGRNLVADYDLVVVYGDGAELRRRYPPRGGEPNLVVLEPDPLLHLYGQVAPQSQVYVDLFNLPGWQAQRFLEVLDRNLLRDVA